MYTFHPGVILRQTKQPFIKRKNKKQSSPCIPSTPSLVQAFRMTLTGINEPPLPGKIRMLVKKDLPDYIKIPLYSHDRSITEWHTLFESYSTWKIIPQQEIIAQYNAFFHWKATGILLKKEYEKQMRSRFIIKKWIQQVRTKIYRRHIVGETDLRTLEPIANKDAVEVFCHSTKSVYRFHVNSLIRMIKENLCYEQWGRADPMEPRNPYTNKPWTLVQLIELIRQIQIIGYKMPSFLSQFVEARYSIDLFYKRNQLQLGIDATRRFFETPDSMEVRSDIILQLFEQIQKMHRVHLYRIIQRKNCTPILQERWEILIKNTWIYDNYGYSPNYAWRDTIDQTITIQKLFNSSIDWYNSKYPSVVILAIPILREAALQEPPLEEESDGADSE